MTPEEKRMLLKRELLKETLAKEASAPAPETPSLTAGPNAGGDSPLDLVMDAVTGPLKAVGQVITKPLAELDKVTGAPLRAGVGAFQQSGDLGTATSAAVDQLKAGLPQVSEGGPKAGEILSTTPTGEEIAYQGLIDRGLRPEFAADTAILPGIMTEAALDVTNLIPSGAMTKGAKAAAEGVEATAKAAARSYGKAETVAARTISQVGQRVTGGALKAEKAMSMFRELKAMEMVTPGTFDYGRLAKQSEILGQMREAFRTNQITLPGSHDTAMEIQKMIGEAQYRSRRTPGSERVLEMIKERAFEKQVVVEPPRVERVRDALGAEVEVPVPGQAREEIVPRDLTLDEMDDIVRALDDVGYTGAGNERQWIPNYTSFVKKSRAMADEALQTVPEGQLFKTEKQRESALITAGKERSKLVEAVGNAGLVTAAVTKNPIAIVAKSLTPKAFVGMLATLKVPRDVASTLAQAHKLPGAKHLRDAFERMAESYPIATERAMRASVLLSGKPLAQQMLTSEEAGSLDDIRIFDQELITEEKFRIQGDPELSNLEKAKRLNEIQKNGYIRIKREEQVSTPEAPEESIITPGTLQDIKGAMERASH